MNFNPGPAALPLAALTRAARELMDIDGTGMSIMEHSHRGAVYERVHQEAIARLKTLLSVPDDYEVLLLQGGARQQFAQVPMNLLKAGQTAEYVVTGTWSKQALAEAQLLGEARAVADTEADGTFTRVPEPGEVAISPGAAYLHITSNNTLYGTQFASFPDTGDVPLVADMTSDLLSRHLDISRFGIVYAAAQKNLGPAGVTVVIIRKALVEAGRTDIPAVFRYRSFAAKQSLWNTPPTFAIYMLRNTLAALDTLGGLSGLDALNRRKAQMVYACVDARPDFYRCPVAVASRSMQNVVFRLPNAELEARFLAEAEAAGMVGLRGHRAVGGLRVSLYNGVEVAWVERLVSFMSDFGKAHA